MIRLARIHINAVLKDRQNLTVSESVKTYQIVRTLCRSFHNKLRDQVIIDVDESIFVIKLIALIVISGLPDEFNIRINKCSIPASGLCRLSSCLRRRRFQSIRCCNHSTLFGFGSLLPDPGLMVDRRCGYQEREDQGNANGSDLDLSGCDLM